MTNNPSVGTQTEKEERQKLFADTLVSLVTSLVAEMAIERPCGDPGERVQNIGALFHKSELTDHFT